MGSGKQEHHHSYITTSTTSVIVNSVTFNVFILPGKFSMWTNITPPGGGPPPHYHENEDELFWPLSGAVNFLKGDEWIEVPPKTVIFMPRGTIHTFRNPNNEPLHMLIQTMPGGFERFFQECGNEFAKCGQPDMEKIVAISARYGIHYIQE